MYMIFGSINSPQPYLKVLPRVLDLSCSSICQLLSVLTFWSHKETVVVVSSHNSTSQGKKHFRQPGTHAHHPDWNASEVMLSAKSILQWPYPNYIHVRSHIHNWVTCHGDGQTEQKLCQHTSHICIYTLFGERSTVVQILMYMCITSNEMYG